jgi:hypothetical protein
MLWWEHDHEYMYKGVMFDVVDQFTKGDSVFYKVYEDTKETKLIKKINTFKAFLFGIETENKKENSDTPSKTWFCQTNFYTSVNIFFKSVRFVFIQSSLSKGVYSIHLPPPDYC